MWMVNQIQVRKPVIWVRGNKMNYIERKSLLWSKLGDGALFVLATVSGETPSARTLSGVFSDGKIYFQTDSQSDKAFDIKENKNVAACIGDVQIKGVCSECGHPLADENRWFADAFKALYSTAYKKYTHLKTECLYCIEPSVIKIWGQIDDVPCIETLDCSNQLYSMHRFKEYS